MSLSFRPYSPPEQRVADQPGAEHALPPGLPGAPAPQKKGTMATVLAGIGLMLLKFKSLLFGLKALPFLKLFLTSFTMLGSMWVMALRSGWKFGVGFILLIFLHELGHGAVIKKYGLKSGWPIFIPFVGAMIGLKEPPPSRDADADISFGGPLWGTVASFATIAVYYVAHDPFWLALGSTGLILNMFNLLPVRPLDGGAIAEMFSRRAWILGGMALVGLFFLAPASPALILVLLALPRMLKRQNPDEIEPISNQVRRKWAMRYFGLLAFMGAGIFFSHQLLAEKHLRQDERPSSKSGYIVS